MNSIYESTISVIPTVKVAAAYAGNIASIAYNSIASSRAVTATQAVATSVSNVANSIFTAIKATTIATASFVNNKANSAINSIASSKAFASLQAFAVTKKGKAVIAIATLIAAGILVRKAIQKTLVPVEDAKQNS